MEDFAASIKALVNEYGSDCSGLSIALAIETFRDVRHYPPSFTDDDILSDMERHSNKIAMAAIEIDSKDGVENQTAHSENGMSRTYFSGLVAYKNIVGYAHCL